MAAQETRKETYVVQILREDATSDQAVWEDFATIEAPAARAHRTTILRMAFRDDPPTRTLDVRVLDEASAREFSVKAKQQTSLEIG